MASELLTALLSQSTSTIAETPPPTDDDQDAVEQKETKGKENNWEIDIPPSNIPQLPVPNFIRLFVINRILRNAASLDIDKLVSVFNEDNNKKYVAKYILVNLKKFGIKKYMKSYYYEERQSEIIELIMHKIIFTQFSKEWEKIMIYQYNGSSKKNSSKRIRNSNRNDKHKYQELVFNTEDIMCTIFQFLSEFFTDNELLECSVVDSYWLYHSWNLNSVYFFDLTKLIVKCVQCIDDTDYQRTMKNWQRITKVKYVRLNGFDFLNTGLSKKKLNEILNMVSRLSCIEGISGKLLDNEQSISIFKALIGKHQNQIKSFRIKLPAVKGKYYKSQALCLLNAHTILTGNLFIRWSNKCKKLEIAGNISNAENWMEYIVENCDCTGIRKLQFESTKFRFSKKNSNTVDSGGGIGADIELLLKNFGEKLSNLQQLDLIFLDKCDKYLCRLLQLLKRIILQNNTEINIKTGQYVEKRDFDRLNMAITNSELIIHKLEIGIGDVDMIPFSSIYAILLISNQGVERLVFRNWESRGMSLRIIIRYLKSKHKKLSFDRLKIIEIEDTYEGYSNMISINNFLNLSMIVEKKLFVNAYFEAQHEKENGNFGALFETLCKNVYNLLIEKQIPIYIKIVFKEMYIDGGIDKKNETIFWTYFEQEKLCKEYKKPQCNSKYYIPLEKPQVSYQLPKEDFFSTVVHFCVSNIKLGYQ